jgi:succinyl-CoA synthetase alpha subunit
MPEILEYYGQDEGTRVIMMQTESFKDPSAFLEVASKITPHKPILAIKAGRTRRPNCGPVFGLSEAISIGNNDLFDSSVSTSRSVFAEIVPVIFAPSASRAV